MIWVIHWFWIARAIAHSVGTANHEVTVEPMQIPKAYAKLAAITQRPAFPLPRPTGLNLD